MQAKHRVPIIPGILNIGTPYRSSPSWLVQDDQGLRYEIVILDRFLQNPHIGVRPTTWIERDNNPNRPLRERVTTAGSQFGILESRKPNQKAYNHVD